MSIPANALSDEECLHYAPLDPAAAAELTRRLTAQSIDPRAEHEELQERMRHIEDDADEALAAQSFPAETLRPDNHRLTMHMAGNAVPPLAGQRIIEAMMEAA